MANLSINSTTPEIDTIPEPGRILLITLGVIITTMGIPGNILTIVAIVKCKSLRNRLNIFIVNLCIADVIIVGYLYPYVILDFILRRHTIPLAWCKFNLLVMAVLSPTTFVTLMLITISRFVKIIYEHKFDKIFSATNTVIFCALAWAPGILISAVTATDLSRVNYEHVGSLCKQRGEVPYQLNNIFIIVLSLTYISSILCYLRIWLTLRKHARDLQSNGADSSLKSQLASNRQQLWISFLIVLIYICLTIPGVVVSALRTGNSRTRISVFTKSFVLLLYFSNSSANCIVYGAMHTSIRRYYQQLLPNAWFNRVQPTSR